MCSAFGFASALLHNAGAKRPLMSGIQKHVVFVVAGYAFGEWMFNALQRRWGRRDAILRHYIELHPDRFEEPPKQKYKDVLEEWVPIR